MLLCNITKNSTIAIIWIKLLFYNFISEDIIPLNTACARLFRLLYYII